MQHFFISPDEIFSPRWQQAFPAARILRSPDDLPELSTRDMVWVLLDGDIVHCIEGCVASGARVVALTRVEDSAEAQCTLEVGVCGYVHYLATAEVLEQVCQVILHDGLWLGANLMRQLVLSSAQKLPAAPSPVVKNLLDELTPREKAVAEAVAAGKSNKEVARALDITERTVKAHLSAAFEKLGVRDRLHLVLVLSGQISV